MLAKLLNAPTARVGKSCLYAIVTAAALTATVPVAAKLKQSWNGYHWARTGTLVVGLGDNGMGQTKTGRGRKQRDRRDVYRQGAEGRDGIYPGQYRHGAEIDRLGAERSQRYRQSSLKQVTNAHRESNFCAVFSNRRPIHRCA